MVDRVGITIDRSFDVAFQQLEGVGAGCTFQRWTVLSDWFLFVDGGDLSFLQNGFAPGPFARAERIDSSYA